MYAPYLILIIAPFPAQIFERYFYTLSLRIFKQKHFLSNCLSMHVSLPCRVGSLISTREVFFCGVKSLIEVRKIHSEYTIFVVDDVPPSLAAFDPEYVLYLSVNRGIHIDKAIRLACREFNIDVDHSTIKAVWLRWFNYYGSFTPLLMLDCITDIYLRQDYVRALHINLGPTSVRLDFPSQTVKSGRMFSRKIRLVEFSYDKFIRYIIRRVSERARSPITSYMPLLSTTDQEFKARFTISIEPISSPYIHVRILPKVPWTLTRLIQLDALSINQAALLWLLFDMRVPILIIGPIGSGKTSLANAITFNSCPDASKALIMDVDEMYLPGHNVVKLFERRSYGLGIQPITKDILIAHALRMGVDYIIVNEVRTREEVRSWLDAVTTGHGGVTTFHAANVQSLKIRLENMLGRTINIENEVAIVKTDINYITVQTDIDTRIRKIIRTVTDIIIPRSIKFHKEDLELRIALLSKLIDFDVAQQLSILSQFYREPDKVFMNLSCFGAGGGI